MHPSRYLGHSFISSLNKIMDSKVLTSITQSIEWQTSPKLGFPWNLLIKLGDLIILHIGFLDHGVRHETLIPGFWYIWLIWFASGHWLGFELQLRSTLHHQSISILLYSLTKTSHKALIGSHWSFTLKLQVVLELYVVPTTLAPITRQFTTTHTRSSYGLRRVEEEEKINRVQGRSQLPYLSSLSFSSPSISRFATLTGFFRFAGWHIFFDSSYFGYQLIVVV